MSAALWGVVVGGLLTIGGQFTAEMVKAKVATRGLTETRQAASREIRRSELTKLRESGLILRAVLQEQWDTPTPNAQLEQRLRESKSSFDACVPSVADQITRDACRLWLNIALSWSTRADDAASRESEDYRWQQAMTAIGNALIKES